MINKNLIISLFVLLSGKLFCQVQQSDIYDAINQLVVINNVETLYKKSKPLKIKSFTENEIIKWWMSTGDERISISQIDTVFINQQIKTIKELKWDKSKLNKIVKLRKKAHHYFTIPLFLNKDKDLFIVFHLAYYGPLASENIYELYKKKNNVWTRINLWIESVS
jgi:hypothetical protein